MHLQLWGYTVEEKICLGVRERKRLNITALEESVGGEVELNSQWTGKHGEQKFAQVLVGTSEGKGPLGRRRLMWQDNIKIYCTKIDWEKVD